jgi:hypothetical protein
MNGSRWLGVVFVVLAVVLVKLSLINPALAALRGHDSVIINGFMLLGAVGFCFFGVNQLVFGLCALSSAFDHRVGVKHASQVAAGCVLVFLILILWCLQNINKSGYQIVGSPRQHIRLVFQRV